MIRRLCGLYIMVYTLAALDCIHADIIEQMQFQNQQITDILLSVAMAADVSIIPDESVYGTASHLFTAADFETALAGFLQTHHLYMEKRDGIYYVSRLQSFFSAEEGLLSLRAYQTDAHLLLQTLSESLEQTLLHDIPPGQHLTIHADRLSPEEILQIINLQLPDYRLVEHDNCYEFIHISTSAAGQQDPVSAAIVREDDRYSVQADQIPAHRALQELFELAGYEYVFLTRRDETLRNISFQDRSFNDLLSLILYQAGLDAVFQNETVFVVEIQQSDILKQFREHRVIFLQHIAVQSLPNLLPQGLSSSILVKHDSERNAVILSGTPIEIDPIEEYIRNIDVPAERHTQRRIDLQHLASSAVQELVPGQLRHLKIVPVPETNSLLVQGSHTGIEQLELVLAQVDTPIPTEPIRLRYIQAESLMESLPHGLHSGDFTLSGDSSLVMYHGSASGTVQLRKHLDLVDQPSPQIRYQLLVVQYQRGRGLQIDFEHEAVTAEAEEGSSIPQLISVLGNLLSVNFDVVTHFGMQFASRLSLGMKQNTAHIVADTTLNGITGEQVCFQNTDTYRYRDSEVDPDTGDTRPAGVTREITAGLILQVRGWTSGDDMITMEVDATVSKRGADTRQGDPPPTSERIVQTQVRTRAGTPVIIGGLIQRDETIQTSGIPLLHRIPLVGRLFGSTRESVEESEMVIYIVPFVESGLPPDQDNAQLIQDILSWGFQPEAGK